MRDLLELGGRLKAARKSARLSQTEIGQRVGISKAQICRIEAGENTSMHMFIKLCQALNTSFEALVVGQVDPGLLEGILRLSPEKQRWLREMLNGLSRH